MIYDHIVKFGGRFYDAGQDILVEEEMNGGIEEKSPAPFITYTKTDINRMNIAGLQSLAVQKGIDVRQKSGSELKKLLIQHFGL